MSAAACGFLHYGYRFVDQPGSMARLSHVAERQTIEGATTVDTRREERHTNVRVAADRDDGGIGEEVAYERAVGRNIVASDGPDVITARWDLYFQVSTGGLHDQVSAATPFQHLAIAFKNRDVLRVVADAAGIVDFGDEDV